MSFERSSDRWREQAEDPTLQRDVASEIVHEVCELSRRERLRSVG